MRLRFLLGTITFALAAAARADHGTFRMLSNRPFETVGAGLASACAAEVRDPTDREEIDRAIAARLQALRRDPNRGHWQRLEQRLRRMGRLKPRQRLRFDRTFVVTSGGRMLVPWPSPAAIRRQSTPTMSFAFANFSLADQQRLSDFLAAAMPHMISVFGDPFETSTVTIRADANLASLEAGLYIVSTNEVRIPPLSDNFQADMFNLTHMVLHAFHGAAVFTFDAWEEGFTHAAAHLAFKRVDPTFDALDDPFYVFQQHDAMNLPALGNPTFFPQGFGGMTPWRLGMSEAAWLKVAAENLNFFRLFHQQYYLQFDPGAAAPLSGNVPGLKVIAQSVVPTVEGQSFNAWYRSEYALDTAASFGNKLYVFTLPLDGSLPMLIYNYTTSSTGDESPLTGRASLTYRNDESPDLFAEEGNLADISAGEGAIAPQFFNLGTPNRLFIDLVAGDLQLTIPFPWHVAGGPHPNFAPLFGTVLNSDTGTISVTPEGGAPLTAEVNRGVFKFAGGLQFTGPTRVTIDYTPSDGGAPFTIRRNTMVGFYELIFASRPVLTTATRTFAAGVHLMSLPLSPLVSDEADALGIPRNRLLLARWRPDLPGSNKYEIYPNLNGSFQPGLGYWLKVFEDTSVNVQGVPPATDGPTRIRLTTGFNLIGDPFTAPVNLGDVRIEPFGGGQVDLQTAINQGLIAPGIFRFDPGQGYVIETSQLQPFRGYWIRATSLSAVTLVINPPAGLSARTLRSPQRRAAAAPPATSSRHLSHPLQPPSGRHTLEHWMLRLRADAPGARDGENFLGVCPGATEAFDAKLEIVKPPHLTDYVALHFAPPVGAPKEARLATDLRAPFLGQKSWEFVVDTDLRDAEVTLSWPGIHVLPKELRFHLTDLDTQQTRSMRTTGGYTFRLNGAARARRFRLSADSSPCPVLAVSQLQSTTVGPNTTLSFNLSRPARVTVDLLGPSGRNFRRLLNGTLLPQGLNIAQWDGRDSGGRAMPRGAYMIQLSATDDEGNVCQYARQVQLR